MTADLVQLYLILRKPGGIRSAAASSVNPCQQGILLSRAPSPSIKSSLPLAFEDLPKMAGGPVKKPVNIFKLKDLGEPKNVFNWRLWFAVISFGLLGAARGVDEGLISGSFKSKDFQNYINYESYDEVEQTNIKGNVSAMVQIGSVGGALL